MAEGQHPGVIRSFVRTFLGSIGLMFIPLPIGIFKRQLAGKIDKNGEMEFYSHPDFVCTMHLIWVGWLVTLGALYNSFAADRGWAEIPTNYLSWPWLFVLCVTLIVMGLQFGRVALGFLIAVIIIVLLGLGLAQVTSELTIFKGIYAQLRKIPVHVEWGVPFVVSVVLGINFVSVAAWRRMNDRWSLQAVGNYLDHENFQEKDRTISKGAKTFVAVFPCLIRRYLFFGYGDIEVRSSTGAALIDRIEGVLYAHQHAEVIKHKFGTTDISTEEEEESEAVADEAL
jgi:hypothetical protein